MAIRDVEDPSGTTRGPSGTDVKCAGRCVRAANREYATNTYRFEETSRGDAMHAEGFVKALIDLEGGILGCHIIGPDASTLIQEVIVAMKAGSGRVQDIRESVQIHPALPEIVQRAFSGRFSRGGHQHEHYH